MVRFMREVTRGVAPTRVSSAAHTSFAPIGDTGGAARGVASPRKHERQPRTPVVVRGAGDADATEAQGLSVPLSAPASPKLRRSCSRARAADCAAAVASCVTATAVSACSCAPEAAARPGTLASRLASAFSSSPRRSANAAACARTATTTRCSSGAGDGAGSGSASPLGLSGARSSPRRETLSFKSRSAVQLPVRSTANRWRASTKRLRLAATVDAAAVVCSKRELTAASVKGVTSPLGPLRRRCIMATTSSVS